MRHTEVVHAGRGTGYPIPAKVARHGALGRGGAPAPSSSAVAVGLSTTESTLLCAEPLAPRTLVTLELARPLRPHSAFCHRVTLVGRVVKCERLSRREAALVGHLPDHRRPTARLVVQVLSTDGCLASWVADLLSAPSPTAGSARAV